MVVAKLQKGVQGERRQAPKSSDDVGDVVAENGGVFSAKLREHAVAQHCHTSLCECQSADAAVGSVDDVEGAQGFGCAIECRDWLSAVGGG